ncbi:MAG: type II secretion system protein [Deltaproteobacteria bacterium]|jgi:prepilin-type N-terminal cleavage/methylation domain-containing protein|nr:type II secretion system protein [Deltaproteobacteria bacterium]
MRSIRQKGFTIIELLLAVVIISTGLVGIMSLFDNATRGAMQLDLNVIAANLAHEKLEEIVLDKVTNGYATLSDASYSFENPVTDFNAYTRNVTITEVDPQDLSTTQAGSGYKRVDVTVSWGNGFVMIPTVLSNY